MEEKKSRELVGSFILRSRKVCGPRREIWIPLFYWDPFCHSSSNLNTDTNCLVVSGVMDDKHAEMKKARWSCPWIDIQLYFILQAILLTAINFIETEGWSYLLLERIIWLTVLIDRGNFLSICTKLRPLEKPLAWSLLKWKGEVLYMNHPACKILATSLRMEKAFTTQLWICPTFLLVLTGGFFSPLNWIVLIFSIQIFAILMKVFLARIRYEWGAGWTYDVTPQIE